MPKTDAEYAYAKANEWQRLREDVDSHLRNLPGAVSVTETTIGFEDGSSLVWDRTGQEWITSRKGYRDAV